MKIRIKIRPGDSMWPSQYQGKEVEVRISGVMFPDNTFWGLDEHAHHAEIVSESEGGTGSGPKTLAQMIGFKPARITIES